MFLTGVGIPVLASMNGALGRSLGSPVAATAVVFVVGAAISLAVLGWAGVPGAASFAAAPRWSYFAALFMVFYLLSITFLGPRIGIGNAVFFVLLGQLVAATVIDHFGLFGAVRFEASAQRLAGVAVMAVGVYLAKRT
ncbi:MAG: DMT family transporter [Proteobacteria bacterium]|nr:DMT family transporter [Pseudomonadota bacterium]